MMNRDELRRLANGERLAARDVAYWGLERHAGLISLYCDPRGHIMLAITSAGLDYLDDVERDTRNNEKRPAGRRANISKAKMRG